MKRPTPETIRARVVKGWAFSGHSPAEVAAIRRYLETGETGALPERYRANADEAARGEGPWR